MVADYSSIPYLHLVLTCSLTLDIVTPKTPKCQNKLKRYLTSSLPLSAYSSKQKLQMENDKEHML